MATIRVVLNFRVKAFKEADLLEAGTGSGSTFVGSDHYPLFGDYVVAPPPPGQVKDAGKNKFP